MKILDSALKHGYLPDEIEKVVNECPQRLKFKSRFGMCYVYWGADRKGNMIEVFMDVENEDIFHVMKLSKTIENMIR